MSEIKFEGTQENITIVNLTLVERKALEEQGWRVSVHGCGDIPSKLYQNKETVKTRNNQNTREAHSKILSIWEKTLEGQLWLHTEAKKILSSILEDNRAAGYNYPPLSFCEGKTISADSHNKHHIKEALSWYNNQ